MMFIQLKPKRTVRQLVRANSTNAVVEGSSPFSSPNLFNSPMLKNVNEEYMWWL